MHQPRVALLLRYLRAGCARLVTPAFLDYYIYINFN
jgi:hypothetical protein